VRNVSRSELPINHDNTTGSRLEQNHGGRGPTVDHLEGHGAERHLVRRVVPVLHPHKPPEPTLWPISGEASEVDGDDAVDHL
jgi:hypothetical protein